MVPLPGYLEVINPGSYLAAALMQKAGATHTFEGLPYSQRKVYVRQVESAKAQETRQRRIAGIVNILGS